MTIQYKNATGNLTTTNLTTVLTLSTSTVGIIKSVYFSNTSTGAILCNAAMSDISAGSYDAEFFRDSIATSSSINAAPEGLNLEAGDAIKAQADTGNYVKVLVNYAQIDRSQENG